MEISNQVNILELKNILNTEERQKLSEFASLSSDGVRRYAETHEDDTYRQNYSLDVDRILHSLAYTRYIDKTQVFYLIRHDHITHRILHVQLVSKIARTIARFLRLNEDLVEAIAIGHDIGHTPFGHDGETILSEICQRHGIGCFLHNVQSIQFLDKVERKGKGWNLCLQTLDGILCHDGEIHNQKIQPNRNKTFDTFEKEITTKKAHPDYALTPMTLEGCVARFADTIGYIGRDIEDAIRLDIIKRSDIPKPCVEYLGNTNGTIVYSLVTDVIRNSYCQSYIAFSPEISDVLLQLKAFNYERIYMNPRIKRHTNTIRSLFEFLFDKYLEDLQKENKTSPIFSGFLENMSEIYIQSHRPEEIVRDFIAGMTDNFFLRQCPKYMRPPETE